MKLSSIDISTAPKHAIVYGPPKSGKTRLALALSEKFDVTYLGFENGHNVAKQFPMEWQERIDVIAIPDTRANPMATAAMLRLIKTGKLHTCVTHGLNDCPICGKDGSEFNSLNLKDLRPNNILIVDSLTQLTTSIMCHIGKGGGDDWKPEWEDWRKQGAFLDMILSEFQVAPYNVICISHESLVDTEDEKSKRLVPVAGSANFSRNSAKYFDTVVYCEVKNGKHVFASKTTYANNILTGDRLGVDLSKEGERGLLAIFDPIGNAVNSEQASKGEVLITANTRQKLSNVTT